MNGLYLQCERAQGNWKDGKKQISRVSLMVRAIYVYIYNIYIYIYIYYTSVPFSYVKYLILLSFLSFLTLKMTHFRVFFFLREKGQKRVSLTLKAWDLAYIVGADCIFRRWPRSSKMCDCSKALQ